MADPSLQDPNYQQLASLLNYETNSAQMAADAPTNDTLASQPDYHPEDEPTPRRFSQRGTTRAGFVSGGVILAVLLFGYVMNQIFGTRTPSQTATQTEVYEAQDQLTMSLEPAYGDEDTEVGSLKTEVALQTQEQQLEDMQAELADIDQLASLEGAEATAAASVNPAATTAVETETHPAATGAANTATAVAPAPRPQAAPAPQPQPPTAWEQWLAVSNAGALGVVPPEATTQPGSFSSTPPNRQSTHSGPMITRRPSTAAQSSPIAAPLTSPPAALTAQTAAADLGVYLAGRQPTPGMRHRTRRTVAIGSTANAVIATPILWPGDGSTVPNSRDPNTPKYLVQLEEALTSADQQIVFPQGAKLVVAVAPIAAQSGVATLDVLSVIREEDGQSFAIPPGQLILRGDNGEPLQARRLNDPGGSIFSMDLGLFAVSGLAEVGALMNRPEDQTVNNSLFQGSVSTTYGDPNYLGAVLEGGSGAIAERMAERNDRAIQELAAQPRTWYLPQGTRVQLFVNQTMQIP